MAVPAIYVRNKSKLAIGDLLYREQFVGSDRLFGYHGIYLGEDQVCVLLYGNDKFSPKKVEYVLYSDFQEGCNVYRIRFDTDKADHEVINNLKARIRNESLNQIYQKLQEGILKVFRTTKLGLYSNYPYKSQDAGIPIDLDVEYSILKYYRTGNIVNLRGGLVSTQGPGFTHWGILDGKGNVYHYYVPKFFSGDFSWQKLTEMVKGKIRFQKTPISQFTQDIGNFSLHSSKRDYPENCDHPENVVYRAEQLMHASNGDNVKYLQDQLVRKWRGEFTRPELEGRRMFAALEKLSKSTWDLVRRNCEHSAVWCRYNTWESSQVRTIKDWGGMPAKYFDDLINHPPDMNGIAEFDQTVKQHMEANGLVLDPWKYYGVDE
jgi:hypothetical protein